MIFPTYAFAQWKVDNNNSYLTYISIKKGTVGESNYFKFLSGSVSNDGSVKIEIKM